MSSQALTTRNDEAFAAALMQGLTRTAAYREVFPEKAARMSIGAIREAGSAMNQKPSVARALSIMREEAQDAGIWTKRDSVETLVEIARFGDRASDKIAAVKELDNILGLNAPTAISLTTVERVVIDFVSPALEHQP